MLAYLEIAYVEIIDKETLKVKDLVEPKECWFELTYNDVGECEVYCVASQANINNLVKGNYLKMPNKPYIWVITSLTYTYVNGVPMISAKGKEAKWLLNKRVIQAPLQMPNKVALAIEQLVINNLGTGAIPARQINGFNVYASGINIALNETQAARGNLLSFVTDLLKAYNLGAIVIYENEQLTFKVIQGQDVSATVRFSQSLDNLIESNYLTDDSELGTNALIVSTVNDIDYTASYNTGATGVDRCEIYISSNLSTEYTPVGATEPVKLDLTNPSDLALYKSWLVQEGKTNLSEHITVTEISSNLDLTNSIYDFDKDYTIGDLVGVIDEYFNINSTPRIIKVTFKQDSGGYGEEVVYE